MTAQELYQKIGGDYEQAIRVLRVEKLVDKHIRKLAHNGVIDQLIKAGETMDAEQLFETAHAAKGVCANLGLTELAEMTTEIAEAYRPGTPRTLTDDQVRERLARIAELEEKTVSEIRCYEAE